MARCPQGDRDRRGGRRARAADRRQRDPERDAARRARPDRARLRARDDGVSALSSGPARRVHGGPRRRLDGALHPSAHAAGARHGGRDQSGRGHRGAEILSLSGGRRTAGNRDRRRSRGRAAAARELRRPRRGRVRQRQSGEGLVHAILLRQRLRRAAHGRRHGRQLHVRRQAHRNLLRANRGKLRPQSDAAARRRGGQRRRLRASRRSAPHPLGGAQGARSRRAAAIRPAARSVLGRSAPAQLPHGAISGSLMPAPEKSPQSPSGPAQVLSLGDATAIIVGLIVGAGIFGTPSVVAGAVESPGLLVAVWIAGGAFSVIGALCYAELATAFPSAGGEYHFIGRAYGRPLAFFYGWARMTVVVAGSIAVFAYLFGDYMSRVINLGPQSSALWAALVVTVLTAVNYAGIREGKLTQNFFTCLECGGLVLIIVAGLALAPEPAPAAALAGGGAPWYMGAGIGSAMVFVLFTYGGIVRSDGVAADLMKRVWGPAGEKLISVMIAIAALTSVNGSMIVGARSNYALGRDWPLLGFLGRWDEASGSPRTAMLVQGAIALALVVFGAFQNAGFKGLVEYSLPVFWGFFMLTGIALFILRVKEREAPRPFRVPGYPVVPGIFVLSCAYLFYSSLAYHRAHALVGLGVLAAGALVLLIGRFKSRA